MVLKLTVITLLVITACSGDKQKNRSNNTVQDSGDFSPPAFSEIWNSTFRLRTTETGEVLSIGAVFSDESNVYVYDLADSRMVTFDTTLSVISTVSLQSIGRGTYSGDDFVVVENQFIFLNGVDRRLELFERTSGKHLKSISLPVDLLSSVKKRSRRIINRLYYSDKTLFIGNDYHLVPFDPALGKKSASAKVVTAPEKNRWILYKQQHSFTENASLITGQKSGDTFRKPATHYPLSGKRFFTIGSRLYCVNAAKDSITLSEVTKQ